MMLFGLAFLLFFPAASLCMASTSFLQRPYSADIDQMGCIFGNYYVSVNLKSLMNDWVIFR